MVTVGYEQARGLRDKHQKTDGFSASVSKTLSVPLGRLFEIWSDEQTRAAWLGESFTVRKATQNKSMRVTWRWAAGGGELLRQDVGGGREEVSGHGAAQQVEGCEGGGAGEEVLGGGVEADGGGVGREEGARTGYLFVFRTVDW